MPLASQGPAPQPHTRLSVQPDSGASLTTWEYEETQDLAHLKRRAGKAPMTQAFGGKPPHQRSLCRLHQCLTQCSEDVLESPSLKWLGTGLFPYPMSLLHPHLNPQAGRIPKCHQTKQLLSPASLHPRQLLGSSQKQSQGNHIQRVAPCKAHPPVLTPSTAEAAENEHEHAW